MKQNTAMQILLDAIDKELNPNAVYSVVYSEALEDVRDYILDNFLLEKEKQQIMNGYNKGMYSSLQFSKTPEQYYNETYKQD